MMKRMKKALAIVLSLSLVFTMAVPSFAVYTSDNLPDAPIVSKTYPETQSDDNYTIDYLAIGDSMTNGYLLEGFKRVEGTKLMDTDGYLNVPDGIYPDLFSQHLADKGYNVNLYQYSVNAYRPEEIRYFLEADYQEDDWISGYFKESSRYGHMYGTEEHARTDYQDENADKGYARTKEDLTAAVMKADIISVNLGTNTFANFIAQKLKTWIGMDGRDRLAVDTSRVIDPKYYEIYLKVKETLSKTADSLFGSKKEGIGDTVDWIIDDLAYAVVGYTKNYDIMLKDMKELNPDTVIAVMGLQNNLEGNTITKKIGGMTLKIPMGLVCDVVTGCLNSYLKLEAAKMKGVIYVEPSECATLLADIGELKAGEFNADRPMLEQVMEEISWTVAGYLIPAGDEGVAGITRDYFKLNGMDAAKAIAGDTALADNKDIIAGSLYLGIRDALIKATKDGELSIDNILSVYGGGTNEEITEAVENFKTTLGTLLADEPLDSGKIAEAVSTLLSGDIFQDALRLFILIEPTGAGTHPNKATHAKAAANLEAAYDKYVAQDNITSVIRKAVPVIVGGVAVTFITVAAAKIIKNGIDSGQIAIDPNLQANLQNVFSRAKELLNLTLLNLRSSRTLTFKYI